jgi:hypothetical protein
MRETGVLELPVEANRLWFVRVDQTWEEFLRGISPSTRKAFAGGGRVPGEDAPASEVEAFLRDHGVRLDEAKRLQHDADAEDANAVGTNFTGLSERAIAALERHARWQVHACHAIFGDILGERPAAGVIAEAS